MVLVKQNFDAQGGEGVEDQLECGSLLVKIIPFEQHLFSGRGFPQSLLEILFGSVSDNLLQFRGVHQCAQIQQLD